MYAVISDRQRQHTVRTGDVIICDHIDPKAGGQKEGSPITFEQVLLVGNEGTVRIGKPFVDGVSVVGEVLGDVQGDKLVVFRFKRRKNVRRKKGHRQDYTRVRITEIRA